MTLKCYKISVTLLLCCVPRGSIHNARIGLVETLKHKIFLADYACWEPSRKRLIYYSSSPLQESWSAHHSNNIRNVFLPTFWQWSCFFFLRWKKFLPRFICSIECKTSPFSMEWGTLCIERYMSVSRDKLCPIFELELCILWLTSLCKSLVLLFTFNQHRFHNR